jgi:DDE superfamily endonuclease/Tc5 transposase DNA-binding domain/helix-turn-helix, Psq domain
MPTAIDQAVDEVFSGCEISIRAVARKWGVASSTLSDRVNGGIGRQQGHEMQQTLSCAQEEILIKWIIEQERLGHAPTHQRIREFAAQIAYHSGGNASVGVNWHQRFLHRNPLIRTKIGRKMDYQRVQNTRPEVLKPWFDEFKAIIERYNVDPANIWNMDESGLGLGRCTNQRVVGSSQTSSSIVQSPETREWVTIIEVVSATGKFLRPTVIFKGQSIQTSWFYKDFKQDWIFTTSQNGWTSNNIGMHWLKEVFMPESAPDDPLQTRILLLDGHGSHVPTDFMYECEVNNIKLIYLPAHSSHVLQPLDLSVFSLIKSHYRKEIDRIAMYDDTGPVKKIRFIEFYDRARQFALTVRNIQSGWRGAGLVPFNPTKVLNSRQVKLGQETSQTPSKGRKRALSDDLSHLQTPYNRKELEKTVEKLQITENMTRNLRMAFSKISKGFEELHAIRARDEMQLIGQKVIIDEVRAKRGRKKVAINPNEKFVRIKDIKEAQKAQDAKKALWAARDRVAEAQKTALAMQKEDMGQFMHQFDAVDMEESR